MTRQEVSELLCISIDKVKNIEMSALKKLKNKFSKIHININPQEDILHENNNSLWQEYINILIKK